MTTPATPANYFVRESDIAGYHPANHVGTLNKRLIGPEGVIALLQPLQRLLPGKAGARHWVGGAGGPRRSQ